MPTNTYLLRGGSSPSNTAPTPVTGNTVSVPGGGFYNVDTGNVTFEASGPVLVSYDAGDDGNTAALHQGGSVSFYGSNNTVTVESGALSVGEQSATDTNNVINVGAGVTSLDGWEIQPSDVINLVGYTQADIDAGFAGLDRSAPTAESLTISDAASGAKLSLTFQSQTGSNMPAESQFHAVAAGGQSSSGTPPPTPPPATGNAGGATPTAPSNSGTPPATSQTGTVSPPPVTTTSSNIVPTPADNGNLPTPLSASEVSAMSGLGQPATQAMTFLDEGNHLGTDFQNLGAAILSGQDTSPFLAQVVTDMRQLLAQYASAVSNFANGVAGPTGVTLAIPGQFVVDVINSGLKAAVAGSAPLDQAYGGALSQFFAGAGSAFTGHAAA